jgi:hypothetical protein
MGKLASQVRTYLPRYLVIGARLSDCQDCLGLLLHSPVLYFARHRGG